MMTLGSLNQRTHSGASESLGGRKVTRGPLSVGFFITEMSERNTLVHKGISERMRLYLLQSKGYN